MLGESINPGWHAAVTGSRSLGPPVLIDGFANGWRLDPSVMGAADHNGTVSVVLQWQPQKRVDIALIISVLAILACVLLALMPLRGRRRTRKTQPLRVASADGPALPAATLVGPSEPVERPILVVPFGPGPPPTAVWLSVVTGVATGTVAGLIASPLAGVAAGLATMTALLVPRLRIVLGLVAIAGVVCAGAFVAIHQAAYHPPADKAWPLSFNTASQLVWAGVVFLGAECVVEVVLRRQRTAGSTSRSSATGRGSDPVTDGTVPRPPAQPDPVGRWRPR